MEIKGRLHNEALASGRDPNPKAVARMSLPELQAWQSRLTTHTKDGRLGHGRRELMTSINRRIETLERSSRTKGILLVADDIFVSPYSIDSTDNRDHRAETQQAVNTVLALTVLYPELVLSLLITNQEALDDHRDTLTEKKRELGLHIDLMEGDPIGENSDDLFGHKGLLRRRLDFIESNQDVEPIEERLLFLDDDLQWKEEWSDRIKQEMAAQINEFKQQFGRYPVQISYHFGLHNDPDLYKTYLDFVSEVAEQKKIPFRYYPDNVGNHRPRSLLHTDLVIDSLNVTQPQTEQEVVDLVEQIPDGEIAEVAIHPGMDGYQQQTEIFLRPDLRKKIKDRATIFKAKTLVKK